MAVIAGIIATLITGGSFFPVGQNASRTSPPDQLSTLNPGTSLPATPGEGSVVNPGGGADGREAAAAGASGADQAADASLPSGGSAAGAASSASSTADAAPSSSGISVLPPADGDSASGSGSSSTTPASGSASASSSPSSTASSSAASASAAPAASDDGGSADRAPGSDAPYRVSVGAFGQLSNAQAQEATFRAAGYPVFLAEQGDLNLVLVGPYRTESEAQSAADRIRAGGYGVDPVIYRFRGDDDAAPQATSTPAAGEGSGAAATATSGASAASATPSAPVTSAPSDAGAGRYIQVGAYGSAASAQPQSDRITAMGFRVTERTEGDLVKLLIGPFDADRTSEVKAQLDAAGIDSFVR